jgi:hypothetical protein
MLLLDPAKAFASMEEAKKRSPTQERGARNVKTASGRPAIIGTVHALGTRSPSPPARDVAES